MSEKRIAPRRQPLSDQDVIAAIRANHLQANIAAYEREDVTIDWDRARVDPGGTIYGPGPYLHVPVNTPLEFFVLRVYAPERVRRQLAARWKRAS